jgi:hypothetical protein
MDGRRKDFWEALSLAVRVAQNLGIHSHGENEPSKSRQGGMISNDLDNDMERKTFCNIYIWDSVLSRQLDRITLIHEALSPGILSIIQPGDNEEVDAPSTFTERLLQARLATFWRQNGPVPGIQGPEYDMMAAEERYEKFSVEFLSALPPAFSLQPNAAREKWDRRFPKLPLQRQLLHIAIYDSLCWNFRSLLVQQSNATNLPVHKRVLLNSQKRGLAVAAQKILEGVAELHAMLGSCHTRFPVLVFASFDAAVLLLYLGPVPPPPLDLLLQSQDNENDYPPSRGSPPDPLHAGDISQHACIVAVQGALQRLRMLAEVSAVADVGANALARLLSVVENKNNGNGPSNMGVNSTTSLIANQESSMNKHLDGKMSTTADVSSWPSFNHSDSHLLEDLVSMSTTSMVDDISSWTSFNQNEESPNDLANRSRAQDLQMNWAMMEDLV